MLELFLLFAIIEFIVVYTRWSCEKRSQLIIQLRLIRLFDMYSIWHNVSMRLLIPADPAYMIHCCTSFGTYKAFASYNRSIEKCRFVTTGWALMLMCALCSLVCHCWEKWYMMGSRSMWAVLEIVVRRNTASISISLSANLYKTCARKIKTWHWNMIR